MAYDRNTFFEQCGGDPALMRRVVALFLSDYEVQLGALRGALMRQDLERLYSVSHSIKGAVAQFGAQRASTAARAVEACCRRGSLADAALSVDELESAVQVLAASLRADHGPS